MDHYSTPCTACVTIAWLVFGPPVALILFAILAVPVAIGCAVDLLWQWHYKRTVVSRYGWARP